MIKHGLHALRDTLQQDKELTPLNTSLGIVGVSTASSAAAPASTEKDAPAPVGGVPSTGGFEKFRIVEGDELKPFLESMDPKEVISDEPAPVAAPAVVTGGEAGGADGGVAPVIPPAVPDAPSDSMETD